MFRYRLHYTTKLVHCTHPQSPVLMVVSYYKINFALYEHL